MQRRVFETNKRLMFLQEITIVIRRFQKPWTGYKHIGRCFKFQNENRWDIEAAHAENNKDTYEKI